MMGITVSGLTKIARNRVLHHLLFWVISYYVLLNIFRGSSQFQPIDYLYTIIFETTLGIPVYVNLIFLIHRFLRRGKYAVYFLSAAIMLAAGAGFNHLLFASLVDYVLPGYYFISYYDFIDLLKFFFTFLLLTSLLKLSKEWIELNENKERINLLEKEKLKVELQTLISQVNPHFLFNSLTVLYSLALRNSRETPEAIIKLSDILRYVIYGADSDYVSISSEVTAIENYIHLQRYRVGDYASVDLKAEVTEDVPVAPMLLLQLVENSFKHGIKGDVENTFIRMHLQAGTARIYFLIENNKSERIPTEEAVSGGIGLKNIRERLHLMYRDRASLRIAETAHSFGVELIIDLDHEDHLHHRRG